MHAISNLKPEIENRLLEAVERMPAFPKSAQEVLALGRRVERRPKELVSVIEKDPVMTMNVLRVINSAYYGLPKKVSSVNESAVYLGINTIKNLALATAAIGTLPKSSAADFDTKEYLMHSLSTAIIARHLSDIVGETLNAGDAYVVGLLHDVGKVIIAHFLPEEYSRALKLARKRSVPLDSVEAEVIGADHAQIGAMLADRWQLPSELVRCIAEHHNPRAEASALLDCVRVANQISRHQAALDAGETVSIDERPLSNRFGAHFREVIMNVGSLQPQIDEARAFVNVSWI